MVKKVIVLILSYNGKHLLSEAIESYLDNDYPNFQVIVIDNGSEDGTRDFVLEKYPQVRLIRTEKNLGYSGGFNFGLDYAFNQQDASYVLITNNDVKADPEILSSLVSISEGDESIGFVTGKVYHYDEPDVFQTTGKYPDKKYWRGGQRGRMEKDIGQYDTVEELEWCDDIFWLVSKSLYEATGGYDTEFRFQAEDFDWQARAKKKGFKIFYTPHARLWHKDSITIGKNSSLKMYYDYRNPVIVHMKHRDHSDYILYFRKIKRDLFRMSASYLPRFRLAHLFRAWGGFLSAYRWGIRNNKLSYKDILQ